MNTQDADQTPGKRPTIFKILNWVMLTAVIIHFLGLCSVIYAGGSGYELMKLSVASASMLTLMGATLVRMCVVLFMFSRFSLGSMLYLTLWFGFWIAIMVAAPQSGYFLASLTMLSVSFLALWGYTWLNEPQ